MPPRRVARLGEHPARRVAGARAQRLRDAQDDGEDVVPAAAHVEHDRVDRLRVPDVQLHGPAGPLQFPPGRVGEVGLGHGPRERGEHVGARAEGKPGGALGQVLHRGA
ncbi:hypothetical protein, partial [Streptomyces sp. SID8380]|uniref:hypothetical protein n=1 Tax=Streptomyces sp. SID8380 TaxID=2690360 RepID=UPI001F3F29E2